VGQLTTASYTSYTEITKQHEQWQLQMFAEKLVSKVVRKIITQGYVT
jgi:hypothetical protein